MSETSDQDKFQAWLFEMDNALDRFLQSFPAEVATKLDFSQESLNELEALVLKRYGHIDETRPSSEARFLDGAARYVGEVFRKKLSGAWIIELDDEKDIFYGLPQLRGMRGQRAQLCPLTMVTASVDRRTGDFYHTILSAIDRNQAR